MPSAPTVAYVIDPRFQGGTSAAVAAELRVMAGLARIKVHAVESRMFAGRAVAPPLAEAFHDLGIEPDWSGAAIGADMAIVHNPAFLKFEERFDRRIIARRLVVVTHENFLRPGHAPSFDVDRCLAHLDRASLALDKSLAPVSAANRATVETWLRAAPAHRRWSVLDRDWTNICDFPRLAPSARPADRRGRLSRPGPEKFPPLAELDLCFPPGAEANVILGADRLIAAGIERPHWTMIPFGGLAVPRFFDRIDFLVHFTASTWRESFGRALAEAIAAGKVVITDRETAATFVDAAIAASPAEVYAVIARFVADPALYRDQALRAQARLDTFSAGAFRAMLGSVMSATVGAAA